MSHKKYTPYEDVNALLHLLLINAKEILKDQFVGMYLYGSLSSGDFNPETSDVDFLVITEKILSEEIISKLEEMHNKTWATSLKRAGKLEGAYIYKELIRKHDPNGVPCPTINEGKFYLDRPGSDWVIQRHVVREYGVVLDGPDPKTLIDFVSPEDIRNSIMGVLREWWYPMLENPQWLRENDDGYRSFAVITMCRVLHGLEHGIITSKPKAVHWARTKVDSRWHSLMDDAVAVSNHQERNIDLQETLGFIRYTKERIEEKSP
jgi:predicted nucleotidyltransferase